MNATTSLPLHDPDLHNLVLMAFPTPGVRDQLQAYRLPVLVVPGNDKTHSSLNGRTAASLIPSSELSALPLEDRDVDIIPFPEWKEQYPALTRKFVDFMRHHNAR